MLQTLQKLGLTDKEAKVYLANLELGPSKIPEISQKSKIKRTTVYVVLDSLIQKGLVSFYESKKTKKFIAEEPEKLALLLKEKQDALTHILPKLKALTKTKKQKHPEVRFYQGKKSCLTILEQALEIPDSEILYTGSIKDIYKIVSREYDYNHFIPTRLKNKIKFKALLFKDKGAQDFKKDQEKYLREIKFLPQEYFFESSQLIFQDKIALISSERELVGVVIQSGDLAKMERERFKLLWSKL